MADLPLSENPTVGRVITDFEPTAEMLTEIPAIIENFIKKVEGQRDSNPESGVRQSWRQRLQQCDRAYRAYLEPARIFKGFNDRCPPIIHDNVEAIVARLKEAILPTCTDNLIKIETEGQDPQITKIRQDQLDSQMDRLDLESKIDSYCRIAVKFGTVYIKVPLVNDEKEVLTRQLVTETIQTPLIDDDNNPIMDANGQPMFHVEQKQSIQILPQVDRKYFGPGYEVISDSETIYEDFDIEDIQDQPIVVQQMWLTWDDLQAGVEKGVYFGDQVAKIKDKTFTKTVGLYTESRNDAVRGYGSSMPTDSVKGIPQLYKVHQAYMLYEIPVKDQSGVTVGKQTKRVMTASIAGTCIQLMANPFFHQMTPLIKGRYRKVEGEAMGIGAIEPVLSLFHAYTDTFNQLEDGKVLLLNPIIIVKGNNLANQQDFPVAPGKVWTERESGDIRNFLLNFPLDLGQQYLEILEQRINRGMGITPLLQGASDQTDLDKTWRGTNKLIQQSDKKFKTIAKGLEDAGLRQWGELAYKVNCQFFPIPQQNGMGFEEINGEINFKVEGVEAYFEKYEKINAYSNFIAQYGQMPGMNMRGLVLTLADKTGVEIDEAKYGPLYTQPQPPPPEEKPLNTSVNISLDPSKGQVQTYMAGQILAQKGVVVDFDAINDAQELNNETVNPVNQAKSGTLPSKYDAYPGKDKRTKKLPKGKGILDVN